MKKTIPIIVFVFICSLGFSQIRATSSHDSTIMVHNQDSIIALINTKMIINAHFMDSVSALISEELKQSFKISEQDKYFDAVKVKQYVIGRLVNAWMQQYALRQKEGKPKN